MTFVLKVNPQEKCGDKRTIVTHRIIEEEKCASKRREAIGAKIENSIGRKCGD